MANCKTCGAKFDWAKNNDRWVLLIPIGEEKDLPRTHSDDLGNLRTLHHEVCKSATYIAQVVRLNEPVLVSNIPVKKRKKKS